MYPWISKLPQGEFSDSILAFRRVFYVVGAFSFAINMLLLVPAIYMLQVYDRVLTSRNEVTLYMLSLIMIGLYVLEATLEFIRSRVLIRVSAALDLRISSRVFNASFMRYLQTHDGSLGQTFGDLASIRQFLTGMGLFAFFDMPWAPIFIIVIFLLNPWLGAFAVVGVLILVTLAIVNERVTGSQLMEAAKHASSANNFASSNLRNAEVIEAMGMLSGLRNRWFSRQSRYLTLQAGAYDRAALVNSVTKFTRLTMQSGILGIGALFVIENQLTAGGMIAASILLGRALAPVDLAMVNWRAFVAARGAFARLNLLLNKQPAHSSTITLPRPQGAVTAENLIVAAPGGRYPILKGLQFRVTPGMLVAVIGPSASGKSTLARALTGVWPPLSGAIRLDGADVHGGNREQFGTWVGYLPQDVELIEGTIAENIARFGTLDSERIVQAAQRAGVHDLILHFPQGYQTPIGEGGMALSGGQRQRIALARALYGDPALIVLDEPNAGLDDAGDLALISALIAMKEEKRTAFVMTHRVNVLAIADSVMLLKNGTIQAFGPRNDVLKLLPRTQTQTDVQPAGKAVS